MRRYNLLFALVLIPLLFPNISRSATLDEILRKHFEAVGQDKLDKIQTLIWQGESVLGPFKLYQKRPGKARLESKFQGVDFVQAYDGEKGWIIAPWLGSTEPQDLAEDDPQFKTIKGFANIDGLLHTYEKDGSKLSFEGSEEVHGRQAYKLKLVESNGTVNYFLLDTKTYLILQQIVVTKNVETGQSSKSTTTFSNYTNVRGVLLALDFVVVSDQGTNAITTESLKTDEELTDAFFTKSGYRAAK